MRSVDHSSIFLRNESLGKWLTLLEKEKAKAQAAKDVEYELELNKIKRVLETGGGIVKKPNAYLTFTQSCIMQQPHQGTLGGAQNNMKKCALKWKLLTEEEKKQYERQGFDVVNLP